MNLILNAIQAIGKKGSITIYLKYIVDQNLIRISFSDSGHGIPEESINTIFDPFFTTYSENVGLGLFLCQQIVHRLGGSIRVESKLNNGSLFIISLPVLKHAQYNSNKISGEEVSSHYKTSNSIQHLKG